MTWAELLAPMGISKILDVSLRAQDFPSNDMILRRAAMIKSRSSQDMLECLLAKIRPY